MFIWIIVILAAIYLDQLTKWLAVIFLDGYPSVPIIQDVLHLTYAENPGAAFGMLSDQRWVFMLISSLAIVFMLIYLWKTSHKDKLTCFALALFIGGGIGNMIDRIFLGYVIDFIDFTLIDFAIFNVADSCVCIAAGLMILSLVLDMIRQKKSEANTESAEEGSATYSEELLSMINRERDLADKIEETSEISSSDTDNAEDIFTCDNKENVTKEEAFPPVQINTEVSPDDTEAYDVEKPSKDAAPLSNSSTVDKDESVAEDISKNA